MRRNLHISLLILALGIGFTGGTALHVLSISQHTQAQEPVNNLETNRILIQGNGVANSSKRPPIPWERFTLFASNAPQYAFKVVPQGKTFILTDIMYNTRLLR